MLNDRGILYLTGFLRALSIGMIGVLLAIYLHALNFPDSMTGSVLTAGLASGTASVLWVTFRADRIGRKRSFIILSSLSVIGGALAAMISSPALMLLAAIVGLLNGMGRDRGAAFVLEQAILPATVSAEKRTYAFAWYSLLQDVAHALGGLLAGLPYLLRGTASLGAVAPFRISIGVYTFLIALTIPLYLKLSPAVELKLEKSSPARDVSPEGKRTVWKISTVFALDSFSGGFLATALLALFFYHRFHVNEAVVGALFFAARVANALSHPVAAWLAKRMGLLNTMVFTHIPSSLFLIMAVLSPTFPWAVGFFLLRESLVEMEVPTRQSFVMSAVRPEDRTYASGITHVVRMGGWAIAPVLAGVFMQHASAALPLIIGAALKIGYDIVLYFSFQKIQPVSES